MNSITHYLRIVFGGIAVTAVTALMADSRRAASVKPDTIGIRPNIVFILADDLGYGSLNCYGAPEAYVATPSIDRLAREGVRFTDASATHSICSPSRYAIMTGEYAWRTERKYGVVGAGERLWPDPARPSLGTWLKANGYRTAHIGKWHLGYGASGQPRSEDWTTSLRPGPNEMGFDYHFGVPSNHDDKMGVFIENDHIANLWSKRVVPFGKNFYNQAYLGFDAPQRKNDAVMSALTEKAVEWLKGRKGDEPFFLFFAPIAVHHPITPSEAMKGRSPVGLYGDFIQELDGSVGRLLQVLSEMGVSENTLVIFSSDNGGEIPTDHTHPEWIARERGLQANGNFRGDKHTIWEGGVRVPLIARWPGAIPAGRTSDAMVSLIDIFATVIDLVDGTDFHERDLASDSFSFRDALLAPRGGFGSTRMSMVVGNASGILAIRRGPWKLIEGEYPHTFPVENRVLGNGEAKLQLYNLQDDPGERVDLSHSHKAIVEELTTELNAIRAATRK